MNEKNLPAGWSIKRLKDVCEINSESISDAKHQDYDFFYQDLSTVNSGRLTKQKLRINYSDSPSRARRLAKQGDVVMSTVRPYLKGFAFIDFDPEEYVFSTGFAILRARLPQDQGYVFQNLFSGYFDYQYHSFLVGSNYPALNSSDVEALRIPYPDDQSERQKIAEILGACDEAIEAQERLIAQKQQRKKGLMQQLLTGQTRFPQFAGTPWREVRLGDIFKERKEAKRDDLELLAVTGNGGVVKRDGLNRKDTSSEDKSKYKRVCPGDIAYNTMRMWQGVSGLSKFEGIVSPAYTIVTPSNVMDPTFSAYFFKLPETVSLFRRYSQGLVNDTLNLKYPNFKVIKVTIPERDEQEAIGQALAACDDEITLQQNKLEQLKQQKKGLMQQLLTGKVRVKV
ncbi:MAG: restriction endonuclease subunit S [Opitutales bacterium]